MLLVTSYCNWSGGYSYCQYSDVRNNTYKVGILDTDDLVEQHVDKQTLEKILQNNPDLKIEGLKSHNGKVTQIYIDKRTEVKIKGNYALVARYFTARGNFCRCYLYKKGIGLIHTWETPHYTHYDWDFELEVQGNQISITESIEHPRYDIHFEAKLVDNNGKIDVLYMPSQAEVDRY